MKKVKLNLEMSTETSDTLNHAQERLALCNKGELMNVLIGLLAVMNDAKEGEYLALMNKDDEIVYKINGI